jgi:hypothetical protein
MKFLFAASCQPFPPHLLLPVLVQTTHFMSNTGNRSTLTLGQFLKESMEAALSSDPGEVTGSVFSQRGLKTFQNAQSEVVHSLCHRLEPIHFCRAANVIYQLTSH